MSVETLDRARSEDFANSMASAMNQAAMLLMTSIGHRTGLFDLMGRLPSVSCNELASAAGLSERYVREWLGDMVTAGVMEHDVDRSTFRLPAEHSVFRRSIPSG